MALKQIAYVKDRNFENKFTKGKRGLLLNQKHSINCQGNGK